MSAPRDPATTQQQIADLPDVPTADELGQDDDASVAEPDSPAAPPDTDTPPSPDRV